ncbi:MAG: protein-L-isoaspartate(D-aspartate) O-methyltransferase [Anaerolineales bacterium]|nr:protein-L-isoaspartate(D-aspartate) O-methyltransferase [Anaerolineales bacterium]
MTEDQDFEKQSEIMVRQQIARRGILDQRLLDAMRRVPRHIFVPQGQQKWAYDDGAQRIGMGQTISQPYIVALMTQALKLKGTEKVLEVGTGSGYQAAILGYLAAEVHTIERHAQLAKDAGAILQQQGLTNVQVHIGDGSLGLPKQAPYQGILVTAAAPVVPKPLLEQLDEGGRLVLPVGEKFSQVLQVWQRQGAGYTHKIITAVAFVPLIGEEGWDEDLWNQSESR